LIQQQLAWPNSSVLKHNWAEQANLLVEFLMGNKRRVWPKIERHNFAVRFFERDVTNPLLSEGLLEKVLSMQANKEGKRRSVNKKQQQRKKTTVSVSVAAIDAARLDLAFLPNSKSKQSRIQRRSGLELMLTL